MKMTVEEKKPYMIAKERSVGKSVIGKTDAKSPSCPYFSFP